MGMRKTWKELVEWCKRWTSRKKPLLHDWRQITADEPAWGEEMRWECNRCGKRVITLFEPVGFCNTTWEFKSALEVQLRLYRLTKRSKRESVMYERATEQLFDLRKELPPHQQKLLQAVAVELNKGHKDD